jgi:hypothetical protein
MKLFVLLSVLVVTASAGAVEPKLKLTEIVGVKEVARQGDYRAFEVEFLEHCGDRERGVFVSTVPSKFITEHVRHMVGALVEAGNVACLAADRRVVARVLIPLGDVLDVTPVVLQP